MSNKIAFFIILFITPFFASAEVELRIKSNYEAGTQFYENGNIKMAVLMFKQGAEKGEADSQAALGTHYYFGEGVEQDLNKAVDLFKASAAKGNPLGNAMLGILYQRGEGVENDQVKALEYGKNAAYSCIAQSQDQIAHHYYQGLGTKVDKVEALAWLYISSESGFEASKDGVIQIEGELSESDKEKALARKKDILSKIKC